MYKLLTSNKCCGEYLVSLFDVLTNYH